MKILIALALGAALLAVPAHAAPTPGGCDGTVTLTQDLYSMRPNNIPAVCKFSGADKQKIMATCSVARRCAVSGLVDGCGNGEPESKCIVISQVTVVRDLDAELAVPFPADVKAWLLQHNKAGETLGKGFLLAAVGRQVQIPTDRLLVPAPWN
jgi:hypothetical protein